MSYRAILIDRQLLFEFIGIDRGDIESLTLAEYKESLNGALSMKDADGNPMWPELQRFKNVILT
jgi:hypothetical protein